MNLFIKSLWVISIVGLNSEAEAVTKVDVSQKDAPAPITLSIVDESVAAPKPIGSIEDLKKLVAALTPKEAFSPNQVALALESIEQAKISVSLTNQATAENIASAIFTTLHSAVLQLKLNLNERAPAFLVVAMVKNELVMLEAQETLKRDSDIYAIVKRECMKTGGAINSLFYSLPASNAVSVDSALAAATQLKTEADKLGLSTFSNSATIALENLEKIRAAKAAKPPPVRKISPSGELGVPQANANRPHRLLASLDF